MNTPTHEDIALQAQWLWRDRGCPVGADDQIWLEAERQLNEVARKANGQRASTPAERAAEETAIESMVEYHISPAVPDQEAIRAAQVKESRTAKTPKRTAPKARPAETGKPLWDKSRSA